MDRVFQALSHCHRRRILDLLRIRPGRSVNEVCEHFETSRIAVMKHLRVLEEAGLLTSEKSGRVRRMFLNAMPIQLIHDRWTDEYSGFWAGRLADLKYRVESRVATSREPSTRPNKRRA